MVIDPSSTLFKNREQRLCINHQLHFPDLFLPGRLRGPQAPVKEKGLVGTKPQASSP